MDVKCQQCGVEYEFDDARVTDDGVTVKCTNCGHIFKVKREVRVVTEPVIEPGAISGDWMVRQPSGNVFTFKELTTLQRWIVERKVARSDEISKTGKTWKRLGDIAELSSFFQVVEDAARTAVDIHAAATLPPSVMVPGPAAAAAPYVVAPAPGQSAYVPGALSLALAAPTQPDAVPVQSFAPTPSQPQIPIPVPAGYGPASALPPTAGAAAPAAVGVTWQQPVAPPRVEFELDDEDPVREWQKKRRWPWLLLALVLLPGAGVAALYLLDRPHFDQLVAQVQKLIGGELPPAVTQAVDQARVAVQRDVIADLEQAAAATRAAVAQAPEAPVHAAQAAVEIAQAAAQRDRYDLLKQQIAQAGASDTTELKDQANRASDAAARHFKAGFDAVQKALTQGADNVDAVLAAADYYRLNNRFDQVQQLLTRAQAQLAPGDVRIKLLQALTQAAQKDGQAAAASALASLISADPQLGRARWALVQVRASGGDLDGARSAATALLAAIPQHERARQWLAVNAAAASQPASAAASQAAAAVPATPAVAPETEKPVVEKPVVEKPVAAADELAPAGGYAALIAKANRLRENGNTAAALKLYNRAVELSPGQPEALAGQGWCYLDKNQTAMALSSFQAALDANADYGDAHMGLAETWRARGNKQKAIAEYQRYVQIGGPESEIAKRAIEELSR